MGKKPHKGKWVLLDSQNTTHQMVNPHLLQNIRKAAKPAKIHCNSGSTSATLEGDIGQTAMLHNPPYGIANVILLFGAKGYHHITYNSRDCGGVFKVHTKGGVVKFKPSERGLHYHDVTDEDSNLELMFVNTVCENIEEYTEHELAKAKEAHRLQGMMGSPTEREFTGLVR
jgi:hypothetical protein